MPLSTISPRRLLRRRRAADLPVILMYHRIADPRHAAWSDPWGSAVSPVNFAHHLDILRRRRRILSLNHFSTQAATRSVPPNSVVITFDDGYADNLYAAKPLLQAYEVPATVFVVSSTVDRTGFWWDELAGIFLRPGSLPAQMRLNGTGAARDLNLGASAHLTPEQARAHTDWRGWQPPPTARHALFVRLWRWLRQLPDPQRQDCLHRLKDWAGHKPAPSPRPLSSSELTCLSGGELVEIGAHTATHPSLPLLDAASQDREIKGSKAFLEARIGRRMRSFSYPHGDHDAASVVCVRQAGFERACITGQANVRWPADPLRLPRIQVEDWDPEEFEQRLSQGFIA